MIPKWLLLLVFISHNVNSSSVRRLPENLTKLTVQATGYTPSEDDDYVSFSVKAKPGYIVKFEPFASADRVHHMLLYGCDQPAYRGHFWKGGATCSGASHILYAWARNAPSLTLPENVGFAVGNENDPVQYIVLQVHYAHPFQGNVQDFSGVVLHLSDVKPANFAAVMLFVSGQAIPPKMDAALINMSCSYTGDVELHPFAFRTHTHGMGRVVSAYFNHDSKWSRIGKRNPQWPQLFQPIGQNLVIRKGDYMAAICRFDSHDKTEYTPMGSMGVNEMCNFYMMFYRDATLPDPFPYGAGCGGIENPVLAETYPADGVSILPSHPEWEHVAHQSGQAFGVKDRLKVTQVGSEKLGQVAGLAFDKHGNIAVFHRAQRYWNAQTFDASNRLQDQTPIEEPTILLAEVGKAELKLKGVYGKSKFYMPHGIFIDKEGYYYTTDVGSHQVIKWKISNGELVQVWALGVKFEPGSDTKHFCKPAGVVVSEKDGSVFVADGYCNNRVMHFSSDGTFLGEFGQPFSFQREGGKAPLGAFNLPHDISLDEVKRHVYVADRENGRVQVFTEKGDPLMEIADPQLFQNVYSAQYCPEHGVIFIPGMSNYQMSAFVAPVGSTTAIQYSFRPTSGNFERPHVIRVHSNVVAVGEIAEGAGVLWILDILANEQMPHLSSAELYSSPEDMQTSDSESDSSSLLVFILVFAAIAVAGFVAFMRFRDVSEENAVIDRTGFKPLLTSEPDDYESEDDLNLAEKP